MSIDQARFVLQQAVGEFTSLNHSDAGRLLQLHGWDLADGASLTRVGMHHC